MTITLKVKVLITQSCLTLWDPTGCSPPGFSVTGILQAGILEWVAFLKQVLWEILRENLYLPLSSQGYGFSRGHVWM